MPSNVRSGFPYIIHIAATKERYQRVQEYAQPKQSMNNKTSKQGLFTFMFGDTPVTPPSGYNLPKKPDLQSHLHPLDTEKVVLKLKESNTIGTLTYYRLSR